jgi:two-component system NtrC family response regulator
MTAEKILIVDDEESIRNQLRWGLSDEFDVLTAGTPEEALRLLREERPSVVTLDLTLDPQGPRPQQGLELLDAVVDRFPHTKVIMVTGNESRENALLAIQRGAADYYSKPIELDDLRVILRRALHVRRLEIEGATAFRGRKLYHRMVGESDSIARVYQLVQRVAPTDATVLVVGENGTGKELAAHAIHESSKRRSGPFVPINCGAIPETLLESELFGHERGSFTDAHRSREGKIELADGGTVFLDEIGELPVHLQVKILRFLDSHTVERVGGREPLRLDVRVVAATNRDLQAAIRDGKFREDLFYRLSVVTIPMPPLRERGNDVRLLADYFLDYYARKHNRAVKGFTQASLRALQAHPWPGNVRELENRVQRALILAHDAFLRPEDLDLGDAQPESQRTLQEARDDVERQVVRDALVRNAGNVTRAARDIGVSRPTFHDLLRKHGIEPARYRQPGAARADDNGEAAGDEPELDDSGHAG